jgi:hypothetical protein
MPMVPFDSWGCASVEILSGVKNRTTDRLGLFGWVLPFVMGRFMSIVSNEVQFPVYSYRAVSWLLG